MMHTKHFVIPDKEIIRSWQTNRSLDKVSKIIGIQIRVENDSVILEGNSPNFEVLEQFFNELIFNVKKGLPIFSDDIVYLFEEYRMNKDKNNMVNIAQNKLFIKTFRKLVKPKTANQQKYIKTMREKDISFSIGPAGTGKTYLAMAMALSMLQAHAVKRIILTRPAVEAGEKLGFLPGDIADKVNPYLRPLFDALYDMMDVKKALKMIDEGILEIAPIAFMRGRTLNNDFVVLDEAQNTTIEQMKMFLTRLGFNSRAVITGDITQIDLPPNQKSGLIHALGILKHIEPIGFVKLEKTDIVRHPLVQRIVDAYET